MCITPELRGTGKGFLNWTPLAQALRATVDKWSHLLKLQNFWTAQDSITGVKAAAYRMGKDLYQLHILYGGNIQNV